mmetsp:Transcript_20013/g.49947  ORF Transcript_20013/g.49947 Transcript_20013/m.49947 type:complete len:128 (+) Transcript_20013:359-742(+)
MQKNTSEHEFSVSAAFCARISCRLTRRTMRWITGNDLIKFQEVAKRDSECEKTAAVGGMLGVFTRGRLGLRWDAEIFQEDVLPGDGVVRGPVMDKEGLHLLYVHTCWEPKGEQTKGNVPDLLKKIGM